MAVISPTFRKEEGGQDALALACFSSDFSSK
jgi:hypothetical protein